jgi:elongation factor G
VADVRVALIGGQFHEVDSAQLDFQLAASMAMREAVRRAGPALIEPVMRADISVAREHVGAVTADLSRRRGRVTSANPRGDTWMIEGEVPLAETRRYATDLRSLTGGRCTLSLELLRYDLVPDDVADRIIAERPPVTPPGRPGAGGSRR